MSKKSHGTKIFGFPNSSEYEKVLLFNTNFHRSPKKNNHLKFRQIRNVTVCTVYYLIGTFLRDHGNDIFEGVSGHVLALVVDAPDEGGCGVADARGPDPGALRLGLPDDVLNALDCSGEERSHLMKYWATMGHI